MLKDVQGCNVFLFSKTRNFNTIKADPRFWSSADQILAAPLEISGNLSGCYHFRSTNFPFRWGAALVMYFLCYSRCRTQQPSDQHTPRLCPAANVSVIKHMVWCCEPCLNVVTEISCARALKPGRTPARFWIAGFHTATCKMLSVQLTQTLLSSCRYWQTDVVLHSAHNPPQIF